MMGVLECCWMVGCEVEMVEVKAGSKVGGFSLTDYYKKKEGGLGGLWSWLGQIWVEWALGMDLVFILDNRE